MQAHTSRHQCDDGSADRAVQAHRSRHQCDDSSADRAVQAHTSRHQCDDSSADRAVQAHTSRNRRRGHCGAALPTKGHRSASIICDVPDSDLAVVFDGEPFRIRRNQPVVAAGRDAELRDITQASSCGEQSRQAAYPTSQEAHPCGSAVALSELRRFSNLRSSHEWGAR